MQMSYHMLLVMLGSLYATGSPIFRPKPVSTCGIQGARHNDESIYTYTYKVALTSEHERWSSLDVDLGLQNLCLVLLGRENVVKEK